MTEETQLDATETPAATAEVSEAIKALYEVFVQGAVAHTATNTTVAQAAILMLSDALANMAGAYKLPQDQFNEVVGEMLHYFEQVAMNLSHDVAGVVESLINPPPEQQVVSAADADVNVEN